MASIVHAAPLQSVLQPAGPQAAHVKQLWDLMLLVCSGVFAAVLIGVAIALWRGRRYARGGPSAPVLTDPGPERGARRSVVSAVVASTLLLLFLIVASVFTDRALARLSLVDAVHIEVTSNQWWWEARYDDAEAARMFTTANELHVPVGRPVIVTLRSNDVIHSLWVPNLSGKKDLIPGRSSTMQFQADQPGTYRGQCAEFCGYQHAYMAFVVVAEPNDHYEQWAAHQRTSATEPTSPELARGRELFMTTTCAMCHAIQGTDANAKRAPDLTHLAGRSTIAAGTLPNTAHDLEQWIRDPQRFKPGSNMPASDLADGDVRLLVAYLRSLR
jgi:cytochrome c oxidase subunit 2